MMNTTGTPKNYIKRLQHENAELELEIEDMRAAITAFRRHLLGTKYNGPGNDYISTRDVFRWLEAI